MHSVSIVMPVYNEVPGLQFDALTPRLTALLELLRPIDQVIVVDGQSTDHSWQVLQALAAHHPQIVAMQSAKGRAIQMNAGAGKARGDVLLFLHADTDLTPKAWAGFLSRMSPRHWGRFNVQIQGDSAWLKVVAWFMNHRSRLSKIGTGDQALFMGQELFSAVGGFPQQALMEDIELCKRLKRLAPASFIAIRETVRTSGRRWDENGVWSTIYLMWRFRFLYWRGVSAQQLAKLYADTRKKAPITVAVFAKYPQPGRVKTRLQALLGEAACAQFARYLLLQTLDKLQGSDVALWTDGGTDSEWDTLLAGRNVSRYIQPQGHLGLRMQKAVETHLAHSRVVVLLGPDAVQFNKTHLHALNTAAQRKGVAIAPALDGGYVALACTRLVPEIFSESILWGTSSVAQQTRDALEALNLQASWLTPQYDIDEPADYQKALEEGVVPADWAERYGKPDV